MRALKLNTGKKIDPTRTLTLRSLFVAQVDKRFGSLKRAIKKLLAEDNFLEPITPTEYSPGIILIGLAAKYEYQKSDVKLDQFMGWLKDQEDQGILEIIQKPGGLRRGQREAWSDIYIRGAYQKGIADARADLRKMGANIPSFQQVFGGVSGVFNQPFHADRVALIYSRAFNGMKGITETMNGYLSRELALGMAEGQNPYAIAKRINERVDKIGIVRGRLIARTEVVHTHNEAALNEYERSEIEIGETVKVEWVATMDNRVRPHHAERNGAIYTRDQARGMLGEPNCRCSVAPYVEKLKKKGVVEKPSEKKGVLGNIIPGSPVKSANVMKSQYAKAKKATSIKGKTAQELKSDIAKRLSEKMDSLNLQEWKVYVESTGKISEDAVSDLIKGWAATSGDKNPTAIMMQLVVKEEFGLKGSFLWYKKEALKEANSLFEKNKVALRRFLREMYNDTQEHLKKQKLKTIRVVRGFQGGDDLKLSTLEKKLSKTDIRLQPMSSFSSDIDIAIGFSQAVGKRQTLYFAEIPVDRVISCPVTGFGCKDEFEWVVLASQKKKPDVMFSSTLENPMKDPEIKNWSQVFGRDIDKPFFGFLDVNFVFKSLREASEE